MKSNVSVALATYNGELFLRQQLESIYNQTVVPDEVIACDDCSSDSTVEILNEYSQKYGLKLFQNKTNLGYNKNFEKVLSLCSCNYIAISDQDDIWLENKVELSLKKLKEIEGTYPAMVSTSRFNADSSLNIISSFTYETKNISDYYEAFFGPPSQGASIIINKKLLDIILPFPSEKNYVYDAYISIAAAMCGKKYYLPDKLLIYRLHNFNSHYKAVKKGNKIVRRVELYRNDRFYSLIPQGREIILRLVDNSIRNHFIEERKLLFYKLISIYFNENYFRSVLLIASIKELDLHRRVKVIVNSIIHQIIKITDRII